MNRILVIGIILLIIVSNIIPISGFIMEHSSILTTSVNILYVGGSGPGNYTKIQDAIDDTSDGDTVFVYKGIYVENLIVHKSIDLIGENKNITVIDGNKSEDVVQISSDWVYINGFTIENSGSNLTYAGINICSNYNTIEDNIIANNRKGIQIQNANSNIICNNISNNDYGIWFLAESNSNIIINNTIGFNRWWGVNLDESKYNFFSYNDIFDNGNGINLEESNNNYFSNNIISNNWYGMELSSCNNNTILNNSFLNDDLYVYDSYQNIVFNNTIDGKPIVYLEDKSDIIIDVYVGQIILINCVNISIYNQEFSNMIHSIELWGTNYCLISGNTIIDNHFGIVLIYSSYNTIIGNNISNCTYGMTISSLADSNTIIKNTLKNNGYGVMISEVNNTNLISNNNFSNNGYGIEVYKSSDILISNNTFSYNYFAVSIFFKSNNNTILSNTFLNCVNGIFLHLVSYNKIYRNKIISSESEGVFSISSFNNTISNNTITDCMISIDLLYSYANTILDNIFIKGGISLYYSFENVVSSNLVNDKPIVYLEDTSDINVEEAGQVILINCTNILVQNQDLSNTFFGVELWGTAYCDILNNTMSNNYHSSYIVFSHNNSFSGNHILNFYYSGVNCFSSNDNTFSDNDIKIENEIFKRFIVSCKNSIIKTTFNKYNLQKTQSHYKHISPIVFDDIFLSKNFTYHIQENISSNTSNGIYFNLCYRNIISENNIQKIHEGINLKESNSNIIRDNTIKNNDRGIYLDKSYGNKIFQNNFQENKRHAFFIGCKNTWKENYWNRPRLFPKPIFGKINILSISIPWINIDWHPVRKPYDI